MDSTFDWTRAVARCGVVAIALTIAVLVTGLVAPNMTVDGVTLADILVTTLLFVLTVWLGLWFAVAATGFVLMLHRRPATGSADEAPTREPDEYEPVTAILLPVYNEDPQQVFAGLEAMRQSLADAGCSERFHFFVLSDSTDPDAWLEEERQWRAARRDSALPQVFYRHRPENIARKAGNIADFCERWGAAYRYMIVLDADSLMEASVLVELVRRMEGDRRLGILQTPPLPLGQLSVMSRSQHFIARLCGPMLATGLGWLSGDGGNYWGHNAIIRVDAFTRYCGLCELPGCRPLGGEILSHDFVEAALMRRAGYKVQLAADLTHSYEQSPSTLTAYAQRDQRWCQGNLQHTRLIAGKDIPFDNRFHFLTGVLAYGCSPLWALFLILSPLAFYNGLDESTHITGWVAPTVFAIVLTLLFLPRAMGYLLAVRDEHEREGFGGPVRLAVSTVGELMLSVLMAPILMTFHTLFIWSTLQGSSVSWNAQDRSGKGLTWAEAATAHWWQTLLGLAVGAATAWASPALWFWMLPITTGLVLAIPLSVFVSSGSVGKAVKHAGLLTTPEEMHPPRIVELYHQHLAQKQISPRADEPFLSFLRDAQAVGSHLELLEATASIKSAPPETHTRLSAWILSRGSERLSRDDVQAALGDPEMLRTCHCGIWANEI